MTKRWNIKAGRSVESPKEIEAFLDEIEAVCRKHGFTISHEDAHGAFILTRLDESDIEWLRGAQDGTL